MSTLLAHVKITNLQLDFHWTKCDCNYLVLSFLPLLSEALQAVLYYQSMSTLQVTTDTNDIHEERSHVLDCQVPLHKTLQEHTVPLLTNGCVWLLQLPFRKMSHGALRIVPCSTDSITRAGDRPNVLLTPKCYTSDQSKKQAKCPAHAKLIYVSSGVSWYN